jgi:alpha-beta hydrolase superfamily lysophospholipase
MSKIIVILIAITVPHFQALALPEAKSATRTQNKILALMKSTSYSSSLLKAELKNSGVPELDALWSSRQDIKKCTQSKKNEQCWVISKFTGTPNGQPLVILPGFTGYRKMFLEYIYDMAQNGYGPIYISDFTGTGDSYKSYAKDGVTVPLISERLADKKYKKAAQKFTEKIREIAEDKKQEDGIRTALLPLPLGMGWIKDFDDYQKDLNFIMTFAAEEQGDKKLVVTSLSMSGLVLMMGLHYQSKKPTWIGSVGRIFLESPMLRLLATDKALAGIVSQIGAAAGSAIYGDKTFLTPDASFPDFVNKATGNFREDNIISHSKNRLSLMDSMRVWNGAETGGSTYGWAGQELKNQYAVKLTDPQFNNLNSKMKNIAASLRDHKITMVTVVSNDDPLTDSLATKKFIDELSEKGVASVYLCSLDQAKHQIHAESDFYRDSLMTLLFDQKLGHPIKATYQGKASPSALIKCQQGGN